MRIRVTFRAKVLMWNPCSFFGNEKLFWRVNIVSQNQNWMLLEGMYFWFQTTWIRSNTRTYAKEIFVENRPRLLTWSFAQNCLGLNDTTWFAYIVCVGRTIFHKRFSLSLCLRRIVMASYVIFECMENVHNFRFAKLQLVRNNLSQFIKSLAYNRTVSDRKNSEYLEKASYKYSK